MEPFVSPGYHLPVSHSDPSPHTSPLNKVGLQHAAPPVSHPRIGTTASADKQTSGPFPLRVGTCLTRGWWEGTPRHRASRCLNEAWTAPCVTRGTVEDAPPRPRRVPSLASQPIPQRFPKRTSIKPHYVWTVMSLRQREVGALAPPSAANGLGCYKTLAFVPPSALRLLTWGLFLENHRPQAFDGPVAILWTHARHIGGRCINLGPAGNEARPRNLITTPHPSTIRREEFLF